MAYRRVTKFSDLPDLPLSRAVVDSYNAVIEVSDHAEVTGVAGLLNKLADKEHLDRLMQDKPFFGKTDDPDRYFLDRMFIGVSSAEADETGVHFGTIVAVKNLLNYASGVLLSRMCKTFESAGPAEQGAFLTMMPKNCHTELKGGIEDFASNDEAGRYYLTEITKAMNIISSDTDVSDKLQRICEAVYTIVAADTVLTYDEAMARVSMKKFTIPPPRGGTGESRG
jgi:hypothetical protein